MQIEARVAFYFKVDTENIEDEKIAYMHSQIDYVLSKDFKGTGTKLF